MNQSPQLENIKKNGIVVLQVLYAFLQFNLKHISYYFEDFNETFLKNQSSEEIKEPTKEE